MLRATKRSKAFFVALARQHDPLLLFGRILFARCVEDAFIQLVSHLLRFLDFLTSLQVGCGELEIFRYQKALI